MTPGRCTLNEFSNQPALASCSTDAALPRMKTLAGTAIAASRRGSCPAQSGTVATATKDIDTRQRPEVSRKTDATSLKTNAAATNTAEADQEAITASSQARMQPR